MKTKADFYLLIRKSFYTLFVSNKKKTHFSLHYFNGSPINYSSTVCFFSRKFVNTWFGCLFVAVQKESPE